MKKVLFLVFSSLLVLGACGQKDNEAKSSDNHKKPSDLVNNANDEKTEDSKLSKKHKKDKEEKKDNEEKSNSSEVNQSTDDNNKNDDNQSDSTDNESNDNLANTNDKDNTEQSTQNNSYSQATYNDSQQNQYNQQSNAQNTSNNNQYMSQQDIDEWNKTKPTTHDESQMGYGYGDYLAAKEATKQGKAQNGGKLEGVGGSWPVQDGQNYNSWKDAQIEWQNAVNSTSKVGE